MTDEFGGVRLTRPDPAPDRGPLDDALYDLVEARFRRVVEGHPVRATWLGIHAWDDALGDASRDAAEEQLVLDRRHLAAVEGLDPTGLSARARFERDVELHHVRLALFDEDVVRAWERRTDAVSTLGDALFPLFARDHAPLAERLEAIAGRLEAAPRFFAEHRTRARGRQVETWQRMELAGGADVPAFVDEIVAAADGAAGVPVDAALRRRLRRAAATAKAAVEHHLGHVRDSLATAVDDWPLGPERYEELVRLRELDGLGSEAILAVGYEQLARNHADRAAAARELDPSLDEAAGLERTKDDHPATFAEALGAYRAAMADARAFCVDHGIVTVPDDERVEVVETPGYLRGVLPFAAYFDPPRFEADPVGMYLVTPSVDGDPRALREHYRAGIRNTGIHEAYPGHHLQAHVANANPSLSRLQVDAPEFHEGWAMYAEQMMREEGYDTGPMARIGLATDAIWRAARIVLDVRMHRGEIGVDEATETLIAETGFERPNARAEILRYTTTPTYELSYLLGKVMLLAMRDEERRRLGDAFSLRTFHDALMGNGSLPLGLHRRALRGEAG